MRVLNASSLRVISPGLGTGRGCWPERPRTSERLPTSCVGDEPVFGDWDGSVEGTAFGFECE
jgi:hypothetical protein